MLRREGIDIFIGHRKENIAPDTNLVTYSSAIKDDNSELIEAGCRGLTILKRGELLGLLTWDKKTIAVAGSHGKTTTTAFTGYLLTALGYKPTVFVGGVPLNYSRSAWWGDEYFVIETDESDASFLYYNPLVSLITNIDAEHLDYYKNIENLRAGFQKFAYQTKGKVIGWGEDPYLRDIIVKADGWTYGFSDSNKFRADDFSFDGRFSNFSFFIDNKPVSRVKIPLLGEHNALNSLAVLGFFHYLGEDLARVIDFMADFKGTKRRFQIKEVVQQVTFVDDYAHHPSEIQAVLKAARLLNPRRLVAIFQPHRFSRAKALCGEFGSCFSCADEVIVTDIYSACEKEIEGLSGHILAGEIKKKSCKSVKYVPKDKLIKTVPLYLEEGDIVIGLGAGDINILMDGILEEFKRISNNSIKNNMKEI
jgi:UDP-N-acetylmuramate--alanine ligase